MEEHKQYFTQEEISQLQIEEHQSINEALDGGELKK